MSAARCKPFDSTKLENFSETNNTSRGIARTGYKISPDIRLHNRLGQALIFGVIIVFVASVTTIRNQQTIMTPSLTTIFAGLELRNPVIIGSCGRTAKPELNHRLEEAGAGAIVLKSLFEENIVRRAAHLTAESRASFPSAHSEEADYMQSYLRDEALREYLDLIRESRKLCSIPIIASINCHSLGEWVEFAREAEQAGANAIELNIMTIRTSTEYHHGDFERHHIEILSAVNERTRVPIIVKIGPNLTNPVALVERLYAHGAAGVVLFNRMYQPDIDIERMEYTSGWVLSNEPDIANPLRWTALVTAAVPQLDIALSGGVHSGGAIVKALLAGASAVEVCSAIYRNGDEWISQAVQFVSQWLELHGYRSLLDARGTMSARNLEYAERLERVQFLKYFENFS